MSWKNSSRWRYWKPWRLLSFGLAGLLVACTAAPETAPSPSPTASATPQGGSPTLAIGEPSPSLLATAVPSLPAASPTAAPTAPPTVEPSPTQAPTAAPTATPAPESWAEPEQVSAQPFGSIALVVDGDGNAHAAAALEPSEDGGGLYYLTNAGGSWSEQRVADGLSVDPSIALRADGSVLIAFARYGRFRCFAYGCYLARPQGAFVVDNRSGSWTEAMQIAAASGDSDKPRLAAGSNDVYVAYGSYLASESSGWQAGNLPPAGGSLEDIALGDNGEIHLATATRFRAAPPDDLDWRCCSRLEHLALDATGGWQRETVAESALTFFDLAFDPGGELLLGYARTSCCPIEIIRATRSDVGWRSDPSIQLNFSDPGEMFAAVQGRFDGQGALHMIYDVTFGDGFGPMHPDEGLWFASDRPAEAATLISGGPRSRLYGDGSDETVSTIAIAPAGRPHILFSRLADEMGGKPIGLWYTVGPGR